MVDFSRSSYSGSPTYYQPDQNLPSPVTLWLFACFSSSAIMQHACTLADHSSASQFHIPTRSSQGDGHSLASPAACTFKLEA
mmetsp:Transcript_85755/g.188290  ORF Transcript_85755/g.188290 Transcript_85755/m.188290 type:complete len:82 (-) Transcript_85755:31-276(-)